MFWVIYTAGKRQYRAASTTPVLQEYSAVIVKQKCPKNVITLPKLHNSPKMVKHFGFIIRESGEPFECILFIIMIS